jgi:hypothetical protein
MNYKSILTNMANTFHNKEFFEVILWERNKVLVDAIENSKYEQIFVTYWLIHFDWVYELLKEKDPNREIIEVKNLYPIK